MWNLTTKEWLGLTVVAAIVTTAGSLAAMIIKDYFFARSLETWKAKQSLQSLYQKYRDPILLSAGELCNRLQEIIEDYPPDFLRTDELLAVVSSRSETAEVDSHFEKYKMLSTAFRFCAFLGWLEVYRREIVFLDSVRSQQNSRLEQCLASIRADLADGHLNAARDWHLWFDRLVFREEQRATGEAMLEKISGSSTPTVMGYGAFSNLLRTEGDPRTTWFQDAIRFFEAPPPPDTPDFRVVRFKRLVVHLVELMELLELSRVRKEQLEWKTRYQMEFEASGETEQIVAVDAPKDGRN